MCGLQRQVVSAVVMVCATCMVFGDGNSGGVLGWSWKRSVVAMKCSVVSVSWFRMSWSFWSG